MAIAALLLSLFVPMAQASDAEKSDDSPSDLSTSEHQSTRNVFLEGPFYSLVRPSDLAPERIALGATLFHDPRLSADGKIACASCHDIARGGDDGRSLSVGISGNVTAHNNPTVLNSGLQFRLLWDGRAPDLESQIDGPLHHRDEMGSDWRTVLRTLNAEPSYQAGFAQSYNGVISRETVKDAIATFQRALVTLDAPFDRYLSGDENALSGAAKRGLQLFQEIGCSSCHQGRLLGGNLYQKLGIYHDYFGSRPAGTVFDLGRFNVTGDERDRHYFKVPTLRNSALTAPYLHDGSVDSLEEAVEIMAYYQLGYSLSGEEVSQLVAFLESLTGSIPQEILDYSTGRQSEVTP